jgi:hypothetical protein
MRSLADAAAAFVVAHRIERQSWQVSSANRVELTVIQNQWADAAHRPRLDIRTAPEAVMHALEISKRGHELFDRTRDGAVVEYSLRRQSVG